MAAIGPIQIAAAYQVGANRIRSRVREADAIASLVADYGMNRSSAKDYVDALRHMAEGSTFKRTISTAAAQYFLEHLRYDFGERVAENALKSLRDHIAYYEPVRGARCDSLRRVADQFSPDAPLEDTAFMESEFLDQVRLSRLLPPTERAAGLTLARRKPRKVFALSCVFVRNAHFVAAVLEKANGICEGCSKPAPFISKATGQPFLEVHHKVTLADGGEDTVENAEALCPNCHRRKHFG